MKNYYKVLDLDKNASSSKIKHQVKKKIKTLKDSDLTNKEKKKILLEYEEAYKFLSDYHKRRKLDEYLEMNNLDLVREIDNSVKKMDSFFTGNSLISRFNDVLDSPFFIPKFSFDEKDLQKNGGSFYSYSSSSSSKNKNGNIVIDKYESINNNGKKSEVHKIITKDKDGNEIIKDIPIKKKNKLKYNI